jgi:type IV secretion system protein VirB4
VVCELDLKGFDAELAVISGRSTQVARMNELMAALGVEPEAWLPPFLAENTKDPRPSPDNVHI